MDKIDYSWDEQDNTVSLDIPTEKELSSRHDLQLTRRVFHMASGVVIAGLYMVSLSHQQMIHLLGAIACLIYLIEQIRINYPEFSQKLIPITRFIIRAEEQLKESAMVPYMIAVLLTIITFPKPVAISAVFILAISDPLSAIIGIRFGKTRIFNHKSLEGSMAFFTSAVFITHFVLIFSTAAYSWRITIVSLLLGLIASILETLPIKLDDNLTIPLSTSFVLWPLCEIFKISI